MTALLLLVIIYLAFIGLGLPDSLLGSAWPLMYGSLEVPLHYAGYITMIITGGTVISSLAGAWTVRRFGTGLVAAASILITASATTGFSFSGSFLALCLLALPYGLGAGSVDAALNNYVALHHASRHMSWLHCFWGVGASTGPMIMSVFLGRDLWRPGYRTVGILLFCLALLLFLTLPLWNSGGKLSRSVVPGGGPSSQNPPAPWRELFRIPGVKQGMLLFFCYCSIEYVAGLWGGSYLVMERGLSPERAARWVGLYYAGITGGRFVSGFLTMRLSNRKMVRLGQGLIVCGIAMMLVPAGNMFLLPGLIVTGLGCAPIYPSLLHATPEHFGGEHSQAIMGLQMASAYIGSTVMPPVFGRIAAQAGFFTFPVFIGAILLLKIIMTGILYKKVDAAASGRAVSAPDKA